MIIVIYDKFQWHPKSPSEIYYATIFLNMRMSQVETHQNHIQPSHSTI